MDVIERHRHLLDTLLPGEDFGALTVHRGQFHDVVLGAESVVRFARHAAAADRLPACAARLRAVAALGLGVRTPEVLAEGAGHLLLSRVPGSPLAPEELRDPAAEEAVAEQYAALFAELRGAADGPVPADAAGRADAADPRGAVVAGLEPAPRDGWRDFAAGVRGELYALMSHAGRERAERELAALDGLPYRASAVVHGDLGGENVLWARQEGGAPRLVGVVDWDGAALGDQAEDLAAVGASYGDALLSRIPAAADQWERIRVVRGTFALQQALAAVRDGDEGELRDGLAGYR
ncbi:phosphotransferase family protein [Streptomyces sp. NPDC050504]|uniref:phosphotransferase family protein n=1 Tax=Streptomyces sp. NPDC050504 TaxID=3365618 RepID=UPI0037881335